MHVYHGLNTIRLLLVSAVVCAGNLSLAGQPPPEASSPPVIDDSAQAIDRFIESDLRQKGLTPLPITSDEQFVRRIYLDVIGRIPTLAESRAFWILRKRTSVVN